MRPRLLEEICAKAKLEIRYAALLEEVVTRIEAGGCEVYTREDGKPSSYDPYTDRPPIIRLNVKDVEAPFNVFWDLLHEYGHHLSGKRQEEDQTLAREEFAWKHADVLVRQCPDLLLRMGDYERSQEHDLNTYRAYFGKRKP
jgi:Zn-dependent peptidase ImmA (M78 family)